MQQMLEGHRVRPRMKELVREAARALAALDSERLGELALSCQALNRDWLIPEGAEKRRLASDATEAKQDMIVLARVLDATRANIDVMRRLREIREGKAGYGPGGRGAWSPTEAGRGDY